MMMAVFPENVLRQFPFQKKGMQGESDILFGMVIDVTGEWHQEERLEHELVQMKAAGDTVQLLHCVIRNMTRLQDCLPSTASGKK